MIAVLLRDDRLLWCYLQAIKSLTADDAILCPGFQLEYHTKLHDYIT